MGQSGSCHKENLLVPFSSLGPWRSLMAPSKGCLVNSLSMGGVSVLVWIISLPLFIHLKNDIIWSFLQCSVMAQGVYQPKNSVLTEKMETQRGTLLQLVRVGVIWPECSFQSLISVHESYCSSFLPVTYVGQRLNTRHRENTPKSHCTKCGYLTNEVLISCCS